MTIGGSVVESDCIRAMLLNAQPRIILTIFGIPVLIVLVTVLFLELVFVIETNILMYIFNIVFIWLLVDYIVKRRTGIYLPNGEYYCLRDVGPANCVFEVHNEAIVMKFEIAGIVKEFSCPWVDFSYFKENSNHILLYYKDGNYCILPKRWENQVFLSSKIKQYLKKI